MRTPLALVAWLAMATGGAAAKTVPPDPWEVIHAARVFGEASVGRDALRDPLITGIVDGLRYEIAFYGCWLGRECKTILFQAHFRDPRWGDGGPDAEAMAAWNRAKLIGRASIPESGGAVLDHAVAMASGLPRPTLDATFAAWLDALREFAEYVDFKAEKHGSSGPENGG
ncbi:MAG: YbjN domain-containing protein [Pseudomonadota bacterium]